MISKNLVFQILLGFKFSNIKDSGNPKWAVALGCLFCMSSVICIPIAAIFYWFESRRSQTNDTFQMDSNNLNRSSANI